MRQRRLAGKATILLAAVAAIAVARAQQQPAAPAPPGDAPSAPSVPVGRMESLGGDRYRIGAIVVDKRARRFSVPGRLVHLGEALEYFAVTTGGQKAYESLLELDATGSELNLACILVGLDAAAAVRPTHQFDDRRVEGQAVAIGLSWKDGRRTRRLTALEALTTPENRKGIREQWIYIASGSFGEPPRYAADFLGTLIGFVHDPASVIEHATGLGIGSYGSVAGDARALPPVGTPVDVEIKAIGESR